MTIRVLLVDDQPLVRTGFRMVLNAQDDMAVVGGGYSKVVLALVAILMVAGGAWLMRGRRGSARARARRHRQ